MPIRAKEQPTKKRARNKTECCIMEGCGVRVNRKLPNSSYYCRDHEYLKYHTWISRKLSPDMPKDFAFNDELYTY